MEKNIGLGESTNDPNWVLLDMTSVIFIGSKGEGLDFKTKNTSHRWLRHCLLSMHVRSCQLVSEVSSH